MDISEHRPSKKSATPTKILEPTPLPPPQIWGISWTGDDLNIWCLNPETEAKQTWNLPNYQTNLREVWTSLQRQIKRPPPHLTELFTAYYLLSRWPEAAPYEPNEFTLDHLSALCELFEKFEWNPQLCKLPSLEIFKSALTKSTTIKQFLKNIKKSTPVPLPTPKRTIPKITDVQIIFTPELTFKKF